MMAWYAICTASTRNEAFVPVISRFENFRRRNGSHKLPLFQRVLWWARQGLNLRPHPCEGDWRSRVSALKLRDKIKPPKLPCTSFVRELLMYALPAYAKAFRGHCLAQIAPRVLSKHDPSKGASPDKRKTAGRAATLRSGCWNSCATIAESYRSEDCVTSIIGGEGRHEHHPCP
jgi:hypothetical protein